MASPRQEPVMRVEGEARDRPAPPPVAQPVEPAFEAGSRQAPAEGDLGDLHAGAADHLGADADRGQFAAERDDRQPAAERPMNFKLERAAVRRKPRKFFSRLLFFCVLLAFLGIGAWWIKTSGMLSHRDTGVPNPPAHVEAGDSNGSPSAAASTDDGDDEQDDGVGVNPGLAIIDPQNTFSQDWIEIFKPTDAAKVAGGPQAKAENVSENEGPAVRLTSQSNSPDGSGAVTVPVDVLQKMAGKASTVALTLQSTSDVPTQITVECDFGALGSCGRHRFNATRQKTDALFQVRFENPTAPSGPGRLIINSDVDGKARGINIYAIRVLPGQ
jgi:hypothetical protein